MEGITFNDRPLSEFLIKHETLREAIDRRKLINSVKDKHFLKRHVKSRIKSNNEKNGKVIRLGQFDKNRAIYKKRLTDALNKSNYKSAVIIQLCCENDFKSSAELANEIKIFAEKEGLSIDDKIELRFRVITGYFNKTKLSKYLEFKQSHFNQGKRIPKQIKIRDEYRDILNIDDAVRLNEMNITTDEQNKDMIPNDDNAEVEIKKQYIDHNFSELKEKFSIIFTGDISVSVHLK